MELDISFFKTMAICLICTILIEVVVAYLVKVKDKKDFINIVLVNILTNPLVVSVSTYIFFEFGYKNYVYGMWILEILVVLIEGLIYKFTLKYKSINPFVFALILNCCSYGIGELINDLISIL